MGLLESIVADGKQHTDNHDEDGEHLVLSGEEGTSAILNVTADLSHTVGADVLLVDPTRGQEGIN